MLQLGYSSELCLAKDSTPSRSEGRLTANERPQSGLASSPTCLLSRLSDLMQIGMAKKGACLFHLKFSLLSVDFLLFHFHGFFPFFIF